MMSVMWPLLGLGVLFLASDLHRRLFVRIAVHSALADRSSLDSLSVLVDVPDIEEKFNDVAVNGDYVIPIAKQYRVITSIVMTLQDDGGCCNCLKK